jgi:hypothetical protein
VKALAALLIVVAGAVAAFAIYTFGWRNDESEQVTPSRGPRVYTLRQGDRVRMPSVATECEATVEGAFERLHCSRTSRGRYEVDIFADTVHLYDLDSPNAEPMLPTYSVPATTGR